MKKLLIILGAFLLLIIVVWNTTWARFYFEFGRCYAFSTLHGEHVSVFSEGIDLNWDKIDASLEQFRKENPQSKDTVLYRLFKREPLQVWNWGQYVTNPRYKYPYLSRDQIQYRKPSDRTRLCDERTS